MTILCLSLNAFIKYRAYIHFKQLSFIYYNNLIIKTLEAFVMNRIT